MMEQCKEKLNIAMFGQKRIPSREGGVEIVVKELCTRMVAQGHNVTCYNRGGHHVSGSEYDSKRLKEYKGIRLKTVPTIEKKGLAAVSSSFFAALCCAFGRYDIGCLAIWTICSISEKYISSVLISTVFSVTASVVIYMIVLLIMKNQAVKLVLEILHIKK